MEWEIHIMITNERLDSSDDNGLAMGDFKRLLLLPFFFLFFLCLARSRRYKVREGEGRVTFL